MLVSSSTFESETAVRAGSVGFGLEMGWQRTGNGLVCRHGKRGRTWQAGATNHRILCYIMRHLRAQPRHHPSQSTKHHPVSVVDRENSAGH